MERLYGLLIQFKLLNNNIITKYCFDYHITENKQLSWHTSNHSEKN